jgi:hypothetical protein
MLDDIELEKITLNKFIFAIFKTDQLSIEETLQILNLDKLPLEIQINNNTVFIRDLTRYMVINKLKPNIIEY